MVSKTLKGCDYEVWKEWIQFEDLEQELRNCKHEFPKSCTEVLKLTVERFNAMDIKHNISIEIQNNRKL